MRTVDVYLTIGYPSARHEDVLEFEDDTTDEEIEEEVRDWAYQFIEWGWKEAK